MTGAQPQVLEEFCRRLAHRGPDGHGVLMDAATGAGLVHTRLAIIDLSPGGRQPMESPCGRWVLTFNGEIYNYRDLRAELEAKGHSFASDSDTEVLLALLAEHGTAALDRLVGMFAFALLDRRSGELLLARDRLGIKPLVYGLLPQGGFAFASEIHALRAVPGIDLAMDPEALSQYLACLYVPAPLTIHRGIRKLPPGHWLRWRPGAGVETGCWWRPRYVGERAPTLDEAVEEMLPALRAAVRSCMVADVPVGCFLSGGIDSSVIAALMAEARAEAGAPPVSSFTMTFDEAAYDERDAAKAVSAHLGTRHTELPASSGLVDGLDRMIQAFGEPFGNPTALLIGNLSHSARQHVTVALVGDGGDEVFAGYPRYQGGLLAGRYRKLPALLRRGVIEPAVALLPESSRGRHTLRRIREFVAGASRPDAEMYAGWVEYFDPGERARLLKGPLPASPIAELYLRAPGADPLDRMQQTDLESFLPGNLLAYGDAMSMMHALELRLPFLDQRVVEAVGRIGPALRMAEGKKTLLRRVARKFLPAEIVDRPKLGFNPPMGVWLRRDLSTLVAERLTPARLAELGLDWAPVATLLEQQRSGRRDHALKIWSLLVLESWHRGQSGAGAFADHAALTGQPL
jgi:asparagine synthase (glutamine-hydrolysing)